jgi:hypothetical protein
MVLLFQKPEVKSRFSIFKERLFLNKYETLVSVNYPKGGGQSLSLLGGKENKILKFHLIMLVSRFEVTDPNFL